jgi:hypothetical protein
MKLEFFSKYVLKMLKILNAIKIHLVETDLSHADGRMDIYGEANSHSPTFCESA